MLFFAVRAGRARAPLSANESSISILHRGANRMHAYDCTRRMDDTWLDAGNATLLRIQPHSPCEEMNELVRYDSNPALPGDP